ncbi:MAG: hypothetical protein M1834_009400 [Cirrosporium novae-zelandiae]|nr:MAG: hypothetical protein M1834_009400 [Cirrosporium novae-zelandiae]
MDKKKHKRNRETDKNGYNKHQIIVVASTRLPEELKLEQEPVAVSSEGMRKRGSQLNTPSQKRDEERTRRNCEHGRVVRFHDATRTRTRTGSLSSMATIIKPTKHGSQRLLSATKERKHFDHLPLANYSEEPMILDGNNEAVTQLDGGEIDLQEIIQDPKQRLDVKERKNESATNDARMWLLHEHSAPIGEIESWQTSSASSSSSSCYSGDDDNGEFHQIPGSMDLYSESDESGSEYDIMDDEASSLMSSPPGTPLTSALRHIRSKLPSETWPLLIQSPPKPRGWASRHQHLLIPSAFHSVPKAQLDKQLPFMRGCSWLIPGNLLVSTRSYAQKSILLNQRCNKMKRVITELAESGRMGYMKQGGVSIEKTEFRVPVTYMSGFRNTSLNGLIRCKKIGETCLKRGHWDLMI